MILGGKSGQLIFYNFQNSETSNEIKVQNVVITQPVASNFTPPTNQSGKTHHHESKKLTQKFRKLTFGSIRDDGNSMEKEPLILKNASDQKQANSFEHPDLEVKSGKITMAAGFQAKLVVQGGFF